MRTLSINARNHALIPHILMLLRDLVHERTGIFFDEDRTEQFLDKITPLAARFSSILDYYYVLKYDESELGKRERALLVDVLTVPETYFWREMEQIDAVVHVLVPRWFEDEPLKPLNIWSVGCSTGEEPISLAIALNEANWFQRAKIRIAGGDISSKAIALARRGLYRERSFRKLPDRLRSRYFIREGENWRVVPEIHDKISWHITNLVDERDLDHLIDVPIVFCRNVFLYFSKQAIIKTVNALYERMHTPGYLFIGVSESLVNLPVRFEFEEIGSAFVYVKRNW